MMDTVYLQRMLIIRSGFTSLSFVSFMSCSSDPVSGLRLSAAIPQFPHTLHGVQRRFIFTSVQQQKNFREAYYIPMTVLHVRQPLFFILPNLYLLWRIYLTVYHKYLFHIHVKVSEENWTESLACNTQNVKAKVSIKKIKLLKSILNSHISALSKALTLKSLIKLWLFLLSVFQGASPRTFHLHSLSGPSQQQVVAPTMYTFEYTPSVHQSLETEIQIQSSKPLNRESK